MNHEERRVHARREDDEWKQRIEERLTALETNISVTAKFMAGMEALNTVAGWSIKVVKFLTPVAALALAAVTYFSAKKS